jgi:glycosyltransferase involved in cell wall biosynthesis
MKLIYFHTYGGDRDSGINKKIIAQATHLGNSGIDTSLVLLGGLNKNYPDTGFIHYIPLPDNFFSRSNLSWRLYRQYLAKHYLKDVIRLSDEQTILYVRYPLPILLLPHDISAKRKCKVVYECNAIEIQEEKQSGSYFSYFREIIFGVGFRKHCDAIIGVTDEISRYEVKRSGNLSKPHMTLGNGFAVDSVPERQPPTYSDMDLKILCVATVSFWHGIDRLIQGIADYEGPVNIQLHIAGSGPEIGNLKKLVHDRAMTDRIIFHGFITGQDLDILYNQCHLAVGSLGMHRKGLTMTSELKSREYCARGIPFIIACGDSDFPEDFPAILKLPPNESPIDMNQVILFSSKVSRDTGHAQKMRQFARENLDWSVKMKKLKVFIESLAGVADKNKQEKESKNPE